MIQLKEAYKMLKGIAEIHIFLINFSCYLLFYFYWEILQTLYHWELTMALKENITFTKLRTQSINIKHTEWTKLDFLRKSLVKITIKEAYEGVPTVAQW